MVVHGRFHRLRTLTVVLLCAGAWLASAAGAAEIPDNPVDEDGDVGDDVLLRSLDFELIDYCELVVFDVVEVDHPDGLSLAPRTNVWLS